MLEHFCYLGSPAESSEIAILIPTQSCEVNIMVFIVWVRKLKRNHTSTVVCSESAEGRLSSSCLTLRPSPCCVPTERQRSPFKNSPALSTLQVLPPLEEDSQIILSSFATLGPCNWFLVLDIYSSVLRLLPGHSASKDLSIARNNVRPVKSS